MTKLLLTSAGLINQNIIKNFLQLLNKPIYQAKIIFIPTAARSSEELKYVNKSKKKLVDLGIIKKNIKTINLNTPINFNDVKNYDACYVCGGNTFYLLKKIRETNFDKIIKEFINDNKLYVGVSAGSILAGPNIDIAIPFDKNDIDLKNLTGLNLTKIIVSPHYCKKEKIIIDNFKKKSKYKIIPLTDNQALLINNKEVKIIK